MKEYTQDEIRKAVDPTHWATVNKWLARGDGIAVYENQNLGSRNQGHMQFVSYGSPAAQIELSEPPQRMPDIGGRINWAYQLVGTYKGEAL